MGLTASRGRPLTGNAAIPGDKSCSHRALILGAMARGETRIEGLGESDDVLATTRAVEALGATVRRVDDGTWMVAGAPWVTPESPIDCGNSGTTARLLAGAAAGMPGVILTLTGDASLSRRPMRRLADPLRRMGAKIEGGDTLPLRIVGDPLGGIDHRNVPASAQVKSAILLAALGTDAPVQVVEPVASRDHTEIMLGEFGADIDIADTEAGRTVQLGPCRTLEGANVTIGADPSSAAFALVAAALVDGSEVTVERMLVNPSRTGLYEALERMGADISLANEQRVSGEILADVTVRGGWLEPCHVPPEDVPSMIDEIPVLAMACAAADGESVIAGLGELRHKESDRLGALLAGLTACGVAASVDGDTLHIFGRGQVRGGRVMTQGDHRIAMAFLTLGLASRNGIEVDGEEMIATSFPTYLDVMRGLGAKIA